ncbi:MAG: hypothetical protein HC817_13015 [Saprospiraceae bacterium]|nr:hypothetical protein [Saprospiraceae bacterium]
MRVLFLRSRSQLVDSALEHLSKNYYANLAYEGKIRRGKYIVTRAGTVVDGMVVVSQESRRVLVSVTACDVAYFDERLRFCIPKSKHPNPTAR